MAEREELIRTALTLQTRIDDLVMEHNIENWLSLDLTIGQLKTIMYIYKHRKVNSKDISTALNITPSVVTGIVDRLVSQNKVSRSGGVEDRRVQWLSLTDRGRESIEKTKQIHIESINKILMTLSDGELSEITRGFSIFLRAIESYLVSEPGVPQQVQRN